MVRIAAPLLLTLGLFACGGDDVNEDPADVAAFTLRERVVTIDDAIVVWEGAATLEEAHAAAEAAANLVVGGNGPGYGDRDGNGNVDGDTEFGVLPGLDGTPPGLAEALTDNECVTADVLGGPWGDPAARWDELAAVVAAWTAENNTIPNLTSEPMRIVGWALLALSTDSIEEATDFGGRAQLHVDVTLDAIDC